jgi:hypothetical protein
MLPTSLYADDNLLVAGAQFNPTNIWGSNKEIKICSIVTSSAGVANIDGVYADLYYPAASAIHDNVPSTDLHRDTYAGSKDYGKEGCSAFIRQIRLNQLTKTDGINMFCNQIRTSNNLLPTFYGSGYDAICADPTGDLAKEMAAVYCGTTTVKWEDPAGMYTVKVNALSASGASAVTAENQFQYTELTSFEKDFTAVSYGDVVLKSLKKVPGDLNFGTANLPTVRNLGNTRLWVKVAQDDMGLGLTDGIYNVDYNARLGSNEADWTAYSPFAILTNPATVPTLSQYKAIEDILDLSEEEEIDFSIFVKKWPTASETFGGNIWLDSAKAPFRLCTE